MRPAVFDPNLLDEPKKGTKANLNNQVFILKTILFEVKTHICFRLKEVDTFLLRKSTGSVVMKY